jgi:alkanesulfonate monooxygenase SsuD/methylene tetrahydromethanopterin reductase-like flavin-dependent oxidoreductase (luciferase family)
MAIFVFCSEDEEKVMRQKAVMDHRFLQLERGGPLIPIAYDDIKDEIYSLAEQDRIRYNRQRVVSGTPDKVKARLTQLAADYGIDEIVAVTICEDFDDRLESYRLLAEMFL